MNVARDNILGRVRAALRIAANRPLAPTDAPVFAPVTETETRFRNEFAALRGEIIESDEALRAFVKGFAKIATDGGELAGKTVGDANASVRECDLGVTGCDYLVAQTGSIIVTAVSAGGRAVSVLPPVHLVVARREQIAPDLATAMALLRKRYNKRWPSALSVITGPSRTGDIEKILVMGAHGPKRLALYFAE
ncbi:MAG TPA: lactate utilization protein [Verrucomicrobiae bacterium]|nr:lactate utilization protein [Verrucomicrobiae bacterium]